jgi:hypothetical protein
MQVVQQHLFCYILGTSNKQGLQMRLHHLHLFLILILILILILFLFLYLFLYPSLNASYSKADYSLTALSPGHQDSKSHQHHAPWVNLPHLNHQPHFWKPLASSQ